MKDSFLLYYSFEGNTAAVADLLEARGIPAERLRVEKEPPKKGLGKFLHGGKSALTGEDPGLQLIQADIDGAEFIFLAYPVWAGKYPPAIAALLNRYDLSRKRVAAIACSASGNAEKTFAALESALGEKRLAGKLSLVNPLKYPEETEKKVAEFLDGLNL